MEQNYMVYGYDRVSTKEQNPGRGIRAIEDFCKSWGLKLQKIYIDKMTGKTFERPRYTVLKEDVLRPGDWVIIPEVDRLGRTKGGILQELKCLAERGIRVMILELPTTLMDLSNLGDALAKMMVETINNLLIEMYATLAEAEMQKREKRQREGIENMKVEGRWHEYGRPRIKRPQGWDAVMKRWKSGEIKATTAMKELGLTKTTFYKLVKEEKTYCTKV